jgi:sulfhydrogenase subunit beta (sulfur reductase)
MRMRALSVIDRSGLDALIRALSDRGHRVVGPTVRDGALVLDEVRGVEDLPAGRADEQAAGAYRVRRRDDGALFGYAVGPHAWKQYLFPPRTLLARATRTREGFAVDAPAGPEPAFAFLGVRGCDLAAIKIQDRVFMDAYADPTYTGRRGRAFLVAVNCSDPGETCFCASMGTGPRVGAGHDLALTEIEPGQRFLVEVGSDRGADLLDAVPSQPARPADLDAATTVSERAAASMGRSLDTRGIRELLYANREHPRWDDVADRCLACTNCTLVCPTCFCSTVEDTTDLTGDHAERWRTWDSCFTLDFSELGGSTVRASTRARYRQWLTHKLATWIDQFGTSGCVGCGRCITWCPAAIDITEEVRALREEPAQPLPAEG